MSTPPFPHIALVGAGAIGCTLAAALARAGHPVSVIARGATLETLRQQGITLIDRDGEHRVAVHASPADALPPVDLLFICVKAQDLATVAASVAPLLTPETCVVPVVNGIPWWYFEGLTGRHAGRQVRAVDPDGVLKTLLPSDRIIGCIAYITAERLAPGVVRALNPLRITLGELDGAVRPRTPALVALLQQAGMDADVNPQLRDSLWVKVIANLSSNPLSVVSRACLADIYGHPELRRVSRQILDEVLLTAAAFGARIPFDPETFMSMGAEMGDVRTSMLQDYEKGAPLELAAIGDAVLELAALHGLNLPITENILTLARFLGAHSAPSVNKEEK